jgi:hypothetical protein
MDASSILTYRDSEKFLEEKKSEIEGLKLYVSTTCLEFKEDLCIQWKNQANELMKQLDAGLNSYKLLRIKTRSLSNIPTVFKELKKQALGLYNSFDEMLRSSQKQTEEQNHQNNSNKKFNVVEEMDWVFACLGNELIKESESPNPGSYYYLKKLQNNEDMMKDFYKMYIQRRMPSRDEIDEMMKRDGDTSDADLSYIKNKLEHALRENINGSN